MPSANLSAARWERAGFEALIAPLLSVQKVEFNEPIPRNRALIFTSANGVRYSELTGDDRTVYAIGESTEKAARQAGFVNVTTSGGNWKTLLKVIDKRDKKITHISGRHVRGRIVEALNAQGFSASRRIVYETIPVSDCPEEVSDCDAIALYSPRATETLIRVAPKLAIQADVYCLSEAVAAPLKEGAAYWSRMHVATEPTEGALIACSRAKHD